MGIQYRCDPDHHSNITVWRGDITPQEWSEHLDRVLSDSCFLACRRFLVDVQGARVDRLTIADVDEQMGRFLAAFPHPGATIALVVGNDWDLTKHAETLALENNSAIAFNELTTAIGWLGFDLAIARTTVTELRAEIIATESN